jgi:hypothetical protein
MWFLNDRPLYVRDFNDWESALRWSDQMRDQNSAAGWRLLPEGDGALADHDKTSVGARVVASKE